MSDPSQFDQRRFLPHGTFTSGHGLRAGIWSTLATLTLVLGLVALSLLTGVVATSGPFLISAAESEALSEALRDAAPASISRLSFNEATSAELINGGIIPLMLRGDYVGPGWLIGLGRNAPSLLATQVAIPLLSACCVILFMLHHALELAARRSADAVAAESAARVRGSIHRQSLRLNLSDLDGFGRRQARSLFTGQTDTIASGASRFVFHCSRDPLRIVVCMLILFLIDWRLSVLTALPLIAVWFFVESERTRGVAQQKLAESRAQRALRLLSEGLSKSRLIRGYGMESDEHERFDDQLHLYTKELRVGVDSWRYRQRLSWAAGIIVIGLILDLVGLKVAFDQTVTVADGTLFLSVLAILLGTLLRANGARGDLKRARIASQQVNRYLDRIPEVSQAVGAKFLEPVEKGITFESVTVHHSGKQLFDNLELRLPAQSRTALVSLDPKEARAAAFLLPRFIEPESGRVLFDGEDIAWGTLESLRAECCYVGGREPFFTGTVTENIAAGDKFTDTEILESAKKCHIHKLISQLPDGYETVIGEHGQSLPPGEAFLLGLARAVIRDPAVMIIEEPDAQLSEDMKALIEDAYYRALDGRTVIFLPRRLSTVRRADTVVLLSEGKVAAMGPQEELVKKNDLYRHWEYTTFSPLGRKTQTPSTVEQALADFGAEGVT